jgi:hypothetical protein
VNDADKETKEMAKSQPVTLEDLNWVALQIDIAEGWMGPDQEEDDDWYTPETDPDLAYERHLETKYWMDAEEERARDGHLWPWNKD